MKSNDWLRQSSDGSLSAYNKAFDECYHSLKDGALSETLYKHIYPSLAHLEYVFRSLPTTINMLDICFGLGYNSFTLLAILCKKGYEGILRIYSPEQDEAIFYALLDFNYPPFFAPYKVYMEEILLFFANAPVCTINVYRITLNKMICEFYIYKGDALEMLNILPQESFDIIYQDAFSPKKNPALWSEAYFSLLASLLRSQGIVTTYSQSRSIVQNALRAGLKVYNYESGIVRGGSLMSKDTLNFTRLKARLA